MFLLPLVPDFGYGGAQLYVLTLESEVNAPCLVYGGCNYHVSGHIHLSLPLFTSGRFVNHYGMLYRSRWKPVQIELTLSNRRQVLLIRRHCSVLTLRPLLSGSLCNRPRDRDRREKLPPDPRGTFAFATYSHLFQGITVRLTCNGVYRIVMAAGVSVYLISRQDGGAGYW